MIYPNTLNQPKEVNFNGVLYRLMGKKLYYLSQSTTNEGRRGAKGLHVRVWEHANNSKVEKGFEINHIDRNPLNNDPSNLECITISAHRKLFTTTEKVLNNIEKIRHMSKAWHASPEGIEWHREHGRKTMENRPLLDFECKWCKKAFKSINPHSIFCCRNCHMKNYRRENMKLIEYDCAHCGKMVSRMFFGTEAKRPKLCRTRCPPLKLPNSTADSAL